METDAAPLPTARFRRQHQELYELATQILAIRDPAIIKSKAPEMTARLARFIGKLKVHAAMETQALYPRLLQDTDTGVSSMARQLLDTVGPIYDEVFAFAERWRSSEAMAAAPEVFVKDCKTVMRRLAERVTLETMELYPLVDARGL